MSKTKKEALNYAIKVNIFMANLIKFFSVKTGLTRTEFNKMWREIEDE